MWQWLVIAPAVVASGAYAAWMVIPAASRLRLARWLSRRLRRGPPATHRLADRLERAALPAAGCESCPASRIGPTRNGKAPPQG